MQVSDEQYRLLVDTSPDGLMLTDVSGTILMANTAAARLRGARSGDELLGNTVFSLFAAEDREHVRAIMREAGETGSVRDVEFRLNGGNDSVLAEFLVSAIQGEGVDPSGFVFVVRDITGQRRREEQLRDRALHDPLTGLPNRTLFHDRLGQAIEIARRAKTQVAVLYIDLDHFKQVNDTFGHDLADLLLQQVSGRMLSSVRASDTLARLGGDEFAAVLPQANVSGARVTAKKLNDALRAPFQVGDRSIMLGASIGIANYPRDGENARTILRQADTAMYASKQEKRLNSAWRPEHGVVPEQRPIRTLDSAVPVMQVDPRVLTLANGRDEDARVAASNKSST